MDNQLLRDLFDHTAEAAGLLGVDPDLKARVLASGLSVSELAQPFSLKLPGMMKHLDVLSDAGLITRTKAGRTVSVYPSAGPMREAMEWLKRYERLWTVSIDRLVALVEERSER